MADRIKVRYGEEIEEATTEKMMSAPEHPYTKSLWAVRSIEKPGQSSEDHILSIENVTAAYGKLNVLHNVNITVPRGKTVAIVGESGSGKSTTARVITGLLPPKSGSVNFNGEILPEALSDAPSITPSIQMIYQMADTAMNPRQTVREIISRPVEFYLGKRGREVDQRVSELLGLIELDDSFMDRLPGELSVGKNSAFVSHGPWPRTGTYHL